MFPFSIGSFSLIMVFKDGFIRLQQRIINSLRCFVCAGFQRWKQAKVSQQAAFLLGGGIYARTKVNLSKIKAATTVQITDQGTDFIFIFFHCLWISVLPSFIVFFHSCIHTPFPYIFQSLPFCERLLSFLNFFLLFAFAILLYKK